MISNNTLEKGSVLFIEDNPIFITGDYEVLFDGIPVGSLKNELSWFNQTKVKPEEIDKIVYLGNYQWGYKQLFSIVEEFDNLTKDDKSDVLHDYLELADVTMEL